jgi:hypothetical protein
VSGWNLSGDDHFSRAGGNNMDIEERDRMITLCAQLATEQDRDKFTKLLEELNKLFGEHELDKDLGEYRLDKDLGEHKQEQEPKTN